MQTTRPRITWKVLPMAQVAILKKYSIKVRKDLDYELFYSELKRHNVSHYIYYLATMTAIVTKAKPFRVNKRT